MASMAQLRHVHIPKISSSASQDRSSGLTRSVTFGNHHPPRLSSFRQLLRPNLLLNHARGDGGDGGGSNGGGSGGGGGDENESDDSDSSSSSWVGPIGAFFNGWRSRVEADPQFPFKVLMEELVGVTAAVFGDMSTRPNFGLNELDLVFSTMVVVSIVNFVVMYLLAPTTAAVSAASATPNLFSKLLATCPSSHMFEPGNYGILNRFGTFVYKGAVFAVVGFAAGLVGTTVTNGLVKMRKKMDPKFETQNEAPATLLNAGTWSIHMGLSSNLRYQTLNGVEYALGNTILPGSVLFKTSVVVLRCLNNVLGGMSFVMLARLTGSQSVDGGKSELVVSDEDVKLLEHHSEEDK